MTNDLERTFFDTFGINPKEFKSCDVGTFCPYPEKECGTDTCPYYRTYKVDYPAISDRILLELICTLNKFTGYTSLLNDTYEEVKEEILKDVLFAHEQLRLNKSELSKQVRTLFEEEQDEISKVW